MWYSQRDFNFKMHTLAFPETCFSSRIPSLSVSKIATYPSSPPDPSPLSVRLPDPDDSIVPTCVLSWGPQWLPLVSFPTSWPPSTPSSLLHLKPRSPHFCLKSIHSPELLGSSANPVYPQCPYDLALVLSSFIACSSFTRMLSSTCSEASWLFNMHAVSCLMALPYAETFLWNVFSQYHS